ncbi:MAG: diguanylate cyclase domain-containing protein [Anaerovoracaceae bacterium]
MKSIGTKFITLILSGMLLMAVVISSAGVFVISDAINSDSDQIMNSRCEEEVAKMERIFGDIESAAEIIAEYSSEQLGDVHDFVDDKEYRDAYTEKIENLAVSITRNTEDAIAVYFHYNPLIMPPAEGFFWSKNKLDGEITKFPVTDLSQFGPDEEDKAKWYYMPVHNEAPLWIGPYMNNDVEEYMMSYVIPVYKDGVLIGVTGMDIDFNLIAGNVKNIKVYDSGYAFLTDKDENVVYHKDFEVGTNIKEQLSDNKSKTVIRELSNDMKLVITVPSWEINQLKTLIIKRSIVATLAISLFFIAITVVITHRMTVPLIKLTEVTEQVSNGDFDVDFPEGREDEIGVLSESIQKMVGYLKEYISYINDLIYTDSLTGLRNKAAYQETVHRIERNLDSEIQKFAVIVMDINWLKSVNDVYGHEFGDILIKNTAKFIGEIFDKQSVYRIGGDEFAVVLENDESETGEKLMDEFRKALEINNKNAENLTDKLSVASGIAVYNSEEDRSYHSVFERADRNMYENKEKMKMKESYSS